MLNDGDFNTNGPENSSKSTLETSANISVPSENSNKKKRGRPKKTEVPADSDNYELPKPPPEDKPKPKRIPMGVLQLDIVRALNQQPCPADQPLLPAPTGIKLAVYDHSPGVTEIIKISENNVCTRVPIDVVVNAMIDYTTENLSALPQYTWEYRSYEGCAKLWRAKTRRLEVAPKPFLFKSDPGLCFRRLPFDRIDGVTLDDVPLHKEILSRTNDPQAIVCWHGGLFFARAYRGQYLFMVGEGGDGKGSLIWELGQVFGEGFRSMQQAPSPDDAHWGVDFVDKRVVAFSDFSDRDKKFLTSSQFMGITGEDAVRIRPLYQKPYQAFLDCMIIMASQHYPSIRSLRSDTRRLLFVEFEKATFQLQPGSYRASLAKETAAWVSYCMSEYERLYPDYGVIESAVAAKNIVEAQSGACDDPYQSFFNDYLELSQTGGFVTGADLHKALSERFRHNGAAINGGFTAWMKINRGINRERRRFKGEPIGVYPGIKLKFIAPNGI